VLDHEASGSRLRYCRNVPAPPGEEMSEAAFFHPSRPFTPAEIAKIANAELRPGEESHAPPLIIGVAPLDAARPGDLCFFDSQRYAEALAACRATACLLRARHLPLLPTRVAGLIVDDPHRAMTLVMSSLFPQTLRPASLFEANGVSPGAVVHPEARLEPGVTVDPGAFIGPRAEIGAGTVLGPHAVIGPDVRIGRDCSIGAQASIL
jgi:UDP-3-O-[3-hydroxymyristoyl] glucosamine N-acyltransferase